MQPQSTLPFIYKSPKKSWAWGWSRFEREKKKGWQKRRVEGEPSRDLRKERIGGLKKRKEALFVLFRECRESLKSKEFRLWLEMGEATREPFFVSLLVFLFSYMCSFILVDKEIQEAL